ncbi:hypothetical protein COLO4_38359 [Corchorus olitorius]|uniref:Uncharacterized protein n=1 Tax=Corchorus olitorius TaxID=93759 RepID=A0A1R3FVM8_9ROSI|nr:hypothetical protein COLO4_38359 [Corchorus olitorius]
MDSRDSIINITSIIESHGASTKKTPDCEPKAKRIPLAYGFASKHRSWYNEIRRALKRKKHDNDMGVCIFRVPDHIAVVKPEAYIPQLIGLGPYHHFKTELYEMEPYKLEAVKRATAWIGGDHHHHRELHEEFEKMVGKISKLHCPSMCNVYRGLDHDHQFLAWILTIDGLFLFDLFQTNKAHQIPPTPAPASPAPAQAQPDAHAILKDVLKLENQIPMPVLKAIHSIVLDKNISRSESSKDHQKQLLHHLRVMLVKFCNDVSPIDLDWDSTLPRHLGQALDFPHLLDLLYHYITYKKQDDDDQNPNPNYNTPQPKPKPNTTSDPNNGDQSFSKFLTRLSTDYPSAGVKFKPIDQHGGTQKVEFDSETKTFRLPVVILKPNTEVVLRNLVAYETMAKSKSSNFKRYTELMSAIVDTVEDVKLLMDAEILIFRKKDVTNGQEDHDHENKGSSSKGNKECLSEVEITEMFNGMTKTIESKDRVIDEAIKKANNYYNNTRRVRTYRMMRKYVYSSWKMLTLLASVLLLLLTALQTFCDVYDCPAIFSNQGNNINSNWSVV